MRVALIPGLFFCLDRAIFKLYPKCNRVNSSVFLLQSLTQILTFKSSKYNYFCKACTFRKQSSLFSAGNIESRPKISSSVPSLVSFNSTISHRQVPNTYWKTHVNYGPQQKSICSLVWWAARYPRKTKQTQNMLTGKLFFMFHTTYRWL